MMRIDIQSAWMIATFLVSIRLGALLLLSPLLAGLGNLVTVRVLLCMALASLLAQMGPVAQGLELLTFGQIMFAALAELVIGATLAFAVFTAFGAFSIAGKILDIQAGFGMGSVYDPVTRGGAPLFSTLLNMVGVAVFFGMDGHHAVIRGLVYSLERSPIGAGFPILDPVTIILQFGLMFSLGIALIIPVLLCMLLVEVGLAVVSRVLPQMNVFVVAAPAKVMAGIAIFALTSSVMAPAMNRVYASIFQFWERVFA